RRRAATIPPPWTPHWHRCRTWCGHGSEAEKQEASLRAGTESPSEPFEPVSRARRRPLRARPFRDVGLEPFQTSGWLNQCCGYAPGYLKLQAPLEERVA